jgi:hypothetical protein
MKKILQSALLLTFGLSFAQTLPFYEGFNYPTVGSKLVAYSTTSLVGTTGLGTWSAVANPIPTELMLATNLAPAATAWTGTDFVTGVTHATGATTAITTTSSIKGVVGQYFEISYTITNRTAGSIAITFGGGTNATAAATITATGSYTTIAALADTPTKFKITPTTDFDGTVSNVSIKQNGLSVDDVLIVDSPTTPAVWTAAGLPAVSGKAVAFAGSGIDPELVFNNQTSGKVYSSFVFKATADAANGSTTATGFYSFMSVGTPVGTAAGANLYSASVMIRNSGVGTYNLGLSKSNSITECVWGPTNYTLNQEHVIVISYDNIGDAVGTNQTASLWIDPAINATEPVATLSQNSPTTAVERPNIDRVKILQASSSSTPGIVLDEIRVANTWAGVTTTTLALQPLGTNTFNSTLALKIYPNPVSNGIFYIASTTDLEKEVTIFNTLGQQVLQTKTNNEAINVSNLNKGTYFVKITEAGISATKKLIIQ